MDDGASLTDATVLREWQAAAPTLTESLAARRAPPRALTPSQVNEFDKTGFLLPLRAVSAPEAHAVRGKIEAAEREEQQGGNGLFSNAHLLHDWFYQLATCASVVDVVEDLIGPDVMIWKSQLWIKEGGSGSFVGWHQGEGLT